jgi:hypothetical protein
MWVILYRTDDVPSFVVNEMDYVVCRKPWRHPILQTAVAKKEKENERERGKPLIHVNQSNNEKNHNND